MTDHDHLLLACLHAPLDAGPRFALSAALVNKARAAVGLEPL